MFEQWKKPIKRPSEISNLTNSIRKKDDDVIEELKGQVRQRERTIFLLCEKYLYLKNNKLRMVLSSQN